MYCRVSTRDKGQDPSNQIRELTEECKRLGYELTQYQQYIDCESASGKRRRPEFERMLNDAEHRKFNVLFVWALDRLSREGTLKTLLLIERLNSFGVKVKSLREPWLDPTSPTYDLLVPIFSWVAKAEAQRISDRVRAGLARAKAMGVVLGRRPIAVEVDRVLAAYQQHQSVRTVARMLGYSRTMVHRVVRGHRHPEGPPGDPPSPSCP
jgi:DNA invertase Pin-like site-specific DNA recombinase